jgi:hypothetical protein
MSDTKLIYSKIASIMKETGAITKKQKNAQQGFQFRGIDDVMNELHDIFAKNEVFILPSVEDFTKEDRPTRSGGINTFIRAKIRFQYTTTDGSCVETVNVGEAMDSGDKAMNKAMSIALKYSLLQMLLIPTEDAKDPDAETPEDTDALALALQEINGAKSKDTLNSIYKNYALLQSNQQFMAALTARKNALKNGAA